MKEKTNILAFQAYDSTPKPVIPMTKQLPLPMTALTSAEVGSPLSPEGRPIVCLETVDGLPLINLRMLACGIGLSYGQIKSHLRKQRVRIEKAFGPVCTRDTRALRWHTTHFLLSEAQAGFLLAGTRNLRRVETLRDAFLQALTEAFRTHRSDRVILAGPAAELQPEEARAYVRGLIGVDWGTDGRQTEDVSVHTTRLITRVNIPPVTDGPGSAVILPSTSTALSLDIVDGEPFVDSRVVAEQCQVQHESFYKLLLQHQVSVEEAFGPVRFEIGLGERLPQGGLGQAPKFALLTEDQATFLITMTRNTAKVVQFKIALVKTFSDVRAQLAGRPAISQGQLPDFTNPEEAAQAWLASYEENQQRLDNLRPTTSLLAGVSGIANARGGVGSRAAGGLVCGAPSSVSSRRTRRPVAGWYRNMGSGLWRYNIKIPVAEVWWC